MQRSSPFDQLKIKYNKAWLNTNLAKTLTEKHIASIHRNSPPVAFILFACKNLAFYTKQDFSRGHTLFGFSVFFCFLSESVDCERKSLDFEGRTWNGGQCGAIHTKAYLGPITSRCSGNEPALLLFLGRTERVAEIEPGWCRQQTNT